MRKTTDIARIRRPGRRGTVSQNTAGYRAVYVRLGKLWLSGSAKSMCPTLESERATARGRDVIQ